MKARLQISVLLILFVFAVAGQAQVINNFDTAPADTNYWEWYEPVTEGGTAQLGAHYAISTNADSSKGWIETSFVTDIVAEGEAAMRIDYSVHNSESWGGYSKLHHYFPDTLSTAVYDWTMYDSLSFSYYNVVPQDSMNRVHLRLNIMDYGDVTDTFYNDLGEYLYSFHYILDDEPGWHTVEMPLLVTDSYANDGWTYTGWSGIAGNGAFDKDRIKGFAFEFSVSGAGEGDVVTGSVILDDMKLTGSRNAITMYNGFEGGDNGENGIPVGWGGWMAAWDGWGAQTHFATPMVDDAHSGDYYAELGVDVGNGYAVIWPEGDPIAAEMGQTWEISAWIKDISPSDPGGDFAALKVEAKDADGNVLNGATAEMIQVGVTSEWQLFKETVVMPEGTVTVTPIMVATKWLDDGIAAVYAFDDVGMVNLGSLDTEAPVEVANVTAVPGTNYNLVTWEDIPGEEGETYTVYASQFPITDVTDLTVDVIATGHLEGAPSVVHYLYTPLTDTDVTYYYAVSCTDASANVGPAGLSASGYTNTALGIPTIGLEAPTDFVADGFFDEWAGVTPFEIGVSGNSWGVSSVWGNVDDDDDCSGTIYITTDGDYLYLAAEIIDNVYNGYVGEGNWWDNDALQLFIGLYNQRGPRHAAAMRGAEPDYTINFVNDYYFRDNDGYWTMGNNGDGTYYFESFNPDYVIEAKISLDSLAYGNGFNDTRFDPVNGMRIIIEPIIHDNDGSGAWEGNIQSSPLNQDNAWQTPRVWSHTFVGDMDAVSIDEDDVVPGLYYLAANFPNPFNPSTTISYEIPQSEWVKLTVFNVLGQEVATLVNEVQEPGVHNVHFDASQLASGIYVYRLESGSFSSTQKMILMK